MLAALENLLLPALRSAVGPTVEVSGGSAAAPPAGSNGRLTLFAARLIRQPVRPERDAGHDADEPDESRDPAFFGWQGVLGALAGAPLDFPLPAEADGELVEVQSPPGRLLGAGDAYLLDGRTLRFFRAPEAPVLARTRGAASAGYRARSAGRIELEVQAWEQDDAALDLLLAQSLAALLAAFENLDVIELTGAPPRLGVRLLHPRLRLEALERQPTPPTSGGPGGLLRCRIDGELELALTLGTPAPEGRIEAVELALHQPGKAPGP